MKQDDFIKNIENIDLENPSTHQVLLNRDLSPAELHALLLRIQHHLAMPCSPETSNMLKTLRKQLRSKYSIDLSNKVIKKFMKTTSCKLFHKTNLEFTGIDREIKATVQEIHKKKYFLDKNLEKQSKKKPSSTEKRKRRNVLYSAVSVLPHANYNSSPDHGLVKEKLFILREYIDENEYKQLEETLIQKIEMISQQKFGAYAESIRNYTIYEAILQRIFALIQQNTKNIEIRQRYHKLYKKMKQEMVSIVTNQQQVNRLLGSLERKFSKPIPQTHHKYYKQLPKKNYYQLDRDKQDLTVQIQQTLETAKKAIKDALIKRQRPDYAYEMELSMENRRTPCIRSRVAL